MSALTVGSLFSGIGGLELGVEHATGGRVAFQVERDAWCREVLAKHWPDAVRYDDVCTVRGLPAVDILCGGFPCQDVSLAGKRAGFGGERSSLWREYRRIIADVGPRFVFVENVPGLLTADDGYAFAEVLGDLAALGFDAEWDVFRASDVGAPHRRERLFLLAYRDDCGGAGADTRGEGAGRHGPLADGTDVALSDRGGCGPDGIARVGSEMGVGGGDPRDSAAAANAGACGMADAECGRREDVEPARGRLGALSRPGCGARRQQATSPHNCSPNGVDRGCAQSRVGVPVDGLPRRLDAHQWPAGRGEAQHPGEPPRTAAGVANRAAQLKAYGNAVVPAQAALAWRALSERAGLRGAA